MKRLNPVIADLLTIFKMDKKFVRGEGYYLYEADGTRYTDFIAQYGAIPLGYNHEAIWAALDQIRANMLPSLCQPSTPIKAVELAQFLLDKMPKNLSVCTFGQSGAEAVEAAIKLARAATRKRKIVSTWKSFHGKTAGALAATGQEVYQKPFFIDTSDYIKIPYNDEAALEKVLQEQGDQIAGFLVEPVQGEGGVNVPSPTYLHKAQELCRRYGVLFILDEIQTGLGRMGNWAVCVEQGLEPDILLLSKALGGGIVPIGVCMSTSALWEEDDFGKNHSATFANNNFTCSISLAYLKYLEQNQHLFQQVKQNGAYMRERLLQIQQKWPGVIKEVRGEAYLQAIEFEEIDAGDSYEFAILCSQGGLGYLISGFLLNVYKLRIMPYLNQEMAVRIEPPLTISREEIDKLLHAIDRTCEILYYRDFYHLYRYTIHDNTIPETITDYRSKRREIIVSSTTREPHRSFAFIAHYPQTRDLVINTPSFEQFIDTELSEILEWQADYGEPGVVCTLSKISSKHGDVAAGSIIAIPFGGPKVLERPRKEVVSAIRAAIRKGREMGATVFGLGAYTSIVTRGGIDVRDMILDHEIVTTGNTFTVITSVNALLTGAAKMDISLETCRGAVIGANGSIGRLCAILLSQKMENILLIGRKSNERVNMERLRELANEIYLHAIFYHKERSGIRKQLLSLLENELVFSDGLYQTRERLYELFQTAESAETDNLEEQMSENIIDDIELLFRQAGHKPPIDYGVDIDYFLPELDVILVATSSIGELLQPDLIKSGAVICDVSRPANVGKIVQEKRPDVLVIEGGLVKFPENLAFGQNLGYKPGVNLACLSETILLTLENSNRNMGIGGRITMDDMYYIQGLAEKHGFTLASLHSFEKEIDDKYIARVKAAANKQVVS
ncbi:aminotransferase class III-fold pyridoxal phosphate-dependent enzyme [Brevibacillus sedimenti]|uniref:aminotransferase class III-fold pyridoxal phosphate-dependent enzyme n=1 Tax=Brevibacillus sedimenti TaxID=2613334 RepID=UPI001E6242C2|nr:aminotransferase class III-fold pyridoxal phosphate-dependent enzyme [Anoxybacillus sediminis]UFJ60944.1 aminotransferase class III-fold pyridoxal phosphate-dependent enzyme [Anoxybacillus sediminis]